MLTDRKKQQRLFETAVDRLGEVSELLDFQAYFRRAHAGQNTRGVLLRLARDPDGLKFYRLNRATGEPEWPKTWNELFQNIAGAPPEIVAEAFKFWEEFEWANASPAERARVQELNAALHKDKLIARNKRRRAKDDPMRAQALENARAEKAREAASRRKLERDDRVALWAKQGAKYLDEAVPLRPLVDPKFHHLIPIEQKAIRNQVSGREFLHEVLALPDLDIRAERLLVADALKAIPGWSRVMSPVRHRGELQIVFRRDGTNGKPTTLPAPNVTKEVGRRTIARPPVELPPPPQAAPTQRRRIM